MRIALGLEYCGTRFTGWQSQPDGRGVQDAVEAALGDIARTPVRVVAAGRTDAGVHATSQVVHFDTDVTRPDTAWVRGVNAYLPPDVAVLWTRAVPAEFHARFSAVARHYTYVLMNRPVRNALWADRAGWYHRPLDVDAMRAAASLLVGTHDFSAFRAAECQAKSPVKTLHRADVSRAGDVVRLEFKANAFLHHMIRNIVGSLLRVGSGAEASAWMGTVLAGRDRTRAAATAGAAGLYFTGVEYPAQYTLGATLHSPTLMFDSIAP